MTRQPGQPLPNSYLAVTPSGAYYVASRATADVASRLITHILGRTESPPLNDDTLHQITGQSSSDDARSLVESLGQLGFITALDKPRHVPKGALEESLPPLLGSLSSRKRVLVADAEGFYVASTGFNHETAEELSALSADLASLSERRRGALLGNLRLAGSNWALVDASGNSQVGFWPLHLGGTHFVLVVAGVPRFNQWTYADLIWTLSHRYSRTH